MGALKAIAQGYPPREGVLGGCGLKAERWGLLAGLRIRGGLCVLLLADA